MDCDIEVDSKSNIPDKDEEQGEVYEYESNSYMDGCNENENLHLGETGSLKSCQNEYSDVDQNVDKGSNEDESDDVEKYEDDDEMEFSDTDHADSDDSVVVVVPTLVPKGKKNPSLPMIRELMMRNQCSVVRTFYRGKKQNDYVMESGSDYAKVRRMVQEPPEDVEWQAMYYVHVPKPSKKPAIKLKWTPKPPKPVEQDWIDITNNQPICDVKNPDIILIRDFVHGWMCNTVRIKQHGKKVFDFDMASKRDWDLMNAMINKPEPGMTWRALLLKGDNRSAKVTKKAYKASESDLEEDGASSKVAAADKKKSISKGTKKAYKASAPGFTTESDLEEDGASSKMATAGKKKSVQKVTKNAYKASAPGFTTESDLEDDGASGKVAKATKKKSMPRVGKTAGTKFGKDSTSRKSSPAAMEQKGKSASTKNDLANERTASNGQTSKKSRNEYVMENGVFFPTGTNTNVPTIVREGKVPVKCDDNNDDDDDDNSFFGGDIEAVTREMSDIQNSGRSGKPIDVLVSTGFTNVVEDVVYYMVVLTRSNKVFYVKAEFWRQLLKLRSRNQKKKGYDEPADWIETVNSFRLREKEFGVENKCRRSVRGNTTEVIYFVHAVPVGQGESFQTELEKKLDAFVSVARKRNQNHTGKLCLDYLFRQSAGRQGGLGKWALDKFGPKEDAVEKVMSQQIGDYVAGGYSCHYDVPLNRLMVDYDIKKFLATYAGVGSWSDLSEEMKRACYRDYPRMSLPVWDEIVEEPY
jgi:hypothetical protein